MSKKLSVFVAVLVVSGALFLGASGAVAAQEDSIESDRNSSGGGQEDDGSGTEQEDDDSFEIQNQGLTNEDIAEAYTAEYVEGGCGYACGEL